MTETIVVGAGVGGLAAAIELGAAGRRVTVLEAGPSPGGKAGVVQLDGVEVDTGPSVLTLPEVFRELIARAGLDPDAELVLRRASPGFRYRFPDGVVVDVHHELDATLASVAATLGQEAAGELEAFLRYAAGIWDAAAPAFVFGPAPNVRGMLSLGLSGLTAALSIDAFHSMQGAIDKRVRSPHLRQILQRYATYNGSDMRQAPATLNCIAHVELALGGFGVEGGIASLVRALVRAAEAVGVRFVYGAPVERVLLERRAVRGVVAGGREHRADEVIMNADVAHVVGDLLPAEAGRRIRRSSTPSMSGYTAIYAARRRPDRVPHGVVFPERYAEEFVDIFDRDRPPAEPTVYLCAQEACHGRRGWAEHEPIFVMANAPPEPIDGSRPAAVWAELREAVRARAVAAGQLAPDDRLVWERTPTDLARQFPGSRGAIYGASSNSMTAAFQRPENAVSGVTGLYLASGSAHPGGGLPLAAQSGRLAAQAALAVRGGKSEVAA
ncbi:MAG: phytoene desaturase family protein [Polyangiaceae bacterium]